MSVTGSLSRPIAAGWPCARTGDATPSNAEDLRSVEDRVCLHFRELGDPVFRYLVHCCRDAGDAEELRQEAFLRLYCALEKQERIESVRHWVFKVARNLMLDRAKRLRRLAGKTCEMPDDAAEWIRDPAPNPEEHLFDTVRREQVYAAMRALTDKQRDCVYLRAQGLQLREIGEILDMDLRRVAEVLQRAIATLQRTLNARTTTAQRSVP